LLSLKTWQDYMNWEFRYHHISCTFSWKMKTTHLLHTMKLLSTKLLTCHLTISHLTGMRPWLDKCMVIILNLAHWCATSEHIHCKLFLVLVFWISFYDFRNGKIASLHNIILS
jgi:hypothetical protein